MQGCVDAGCRVHMGGRVVEASVAYDKEVEYRYGKEKAHHLNLYRIVIHSYLKVITVFHWSEPRKLRVTIESSEQMNR